MYSLLSCVISGSVDDGDQPIDIATAKQQPSNTDRAVVSLGYDLMYATSTGVIATPKHVGLSMTVKHKTNSKEIVTLINHAGNCVSVE